MSLLPLGQGATCRMQGLALRDAIDLLSGKWKVCILQILSNGSRRFTELQERVEGITPKVLSKELQALEMNLLITRTVNNTKPVTVSYELTEHALATRNVIGALIEFGMTHREVVKANLV